MGSENDKEEKKWRPFKGKQGRRWNGPVQPLWSPGSKGQSEEGDEIYVLGGQEADEGTPRPGCKYRPVSDHQVLLRKLCGSQRYRQG